MSTHPRILQLSRSGRPQDWPRFSHRLRGVMVVAVYAILLLIFFVMFVSAMTPSPQSIDRLNLAASLADRALYRTQINNRIRALPSISDQSMLQTPPPETVQAYERTQTSLVTMTVPATEFAVHQAVVGYLALARESFKQTDRSAAAGALARLQQLRAQILADYPWLLVP